MMNAKDTRATIERIRRLRGGLQRIELGVDASLTQLKPGHLLLARLSETAWDPYLPEVWTPVGIEGRTITIERPDGRHYSPGQVVSLLAPVGAPYPMRFNLRNLLLLALDTPPTALVLLATLAVRSKISTTIVLGGKATDYPLEALPPEVEVLEGDLEDGWPNQVTTVGWADQVIAIANPTYRMQLYNQLVTTIHELRAEVPKRYLLGIFDLPLPCGVGACQGCGVACQGSDRLVCVDGPAVDLEEIKF